MEININSVVTSTKILRGGLSEVGPRDKWGHRSQSDQSGKFQVVETVQLKGSPVGTLIYKGGDGGLRQEEITSSCARGG